MQIRLDDDLLERFTGQHQVHDPDDADRRLREAEILLHNASSERTRAARLCFHLTRRLVETLIVDRLQCLFDRCARTGLPHSITAMIMAGLLCIMTAILLIVCHLRGTVVIVGYFASFFIAWGLLWIWVSDSRGRDRLARLDLLRTEYREACAARQRADGAYRRAHERYMAAHELRLKLIAAANSQLNNLLSADVDAMDGQQFEQYLVEVFHNLDYDVQHIGQSGDQGVDLILKKGESTIAVQAKCYSQSVGNSAIQEVFTGMKYHGCQRCAVITNEYFTPAAQSLAESVGCILIDRDSLHALICGTLVL